ncbi:MAG: hypothetical protein CL927_02470, partial [Deltaproteobacteria bacterium]|nr:hypothetical protein [Deltaproteobacteria bacterium]
MGRSVIAWWGIREEGRVSVFRPWFGGQVAGRGSTFGRLFTVTTFGESHGGGLGVVIDGCPAGIPLDHGAIATALARRRPGQSKYVSNRKEPDAVEVLSGVFEGHTLGTPLTMIVRNKD